MARLSLDTRNIGYHVHGDGAPLLVLHGTTQAGGAWDAVRASFPFERTWVAVELPGSGESSMPDGPLDLDQIVDDAVAVMEHLGHDTFDVAGYSLGAVVALRMAARHARRVASVTSLCGWAVTDARMRLTFDLWSRLIDIGPEVFMRYALVDGYTADGLAMLEPMIDTVVSMAAGTVQAGSASQLELDARIDIDSCLADISAPCLVIGAVEDRWVDVMHSRHLASMVPGARLIEVPAGHLVIIERAADIAASLAGHIGR